MLRYCPATGKYVHVGVKNNNIASNLTLKAPIPALADFNSQH